jgi:hypothetical protein
MNYDTIHLYVLFFNEHLGSQFVAITNCSFEQFCVSSLLAGNGSLFSKVFALV